MPIRLKGVTAVEDPPALPVGGTTVGQLGTPVQLADEGLTLEDRTADLIPTATRLDDSGPSNNPSMFATPQETQQSGVLIREAPPPAPAAPIKSIKIKSVTPEEDEATGLPIKSIKIKSVVPEGSKDILLPDEPIAGRLVPGNIDLSTRPRVQNPDGTISTIRSMSFNQGGREILVPTVSDDGRILTNQQAIDQYRKTGQHLGIFKDATSATEYAKRLHQGQAAAIQAPAPTPTAQAAPATAPWSLPSSMFGPNQPMTPTAIDRVARAAYETVAGGPPQMLKGVQEAYGAGKEFVRGIAETAGAVAGLRQGVPGLLTMKAKMEEPSKIFDVLPEHAMDAASDIMEGAGRTGMVLLPFDMVAGIATKPSLLWKTPAYIATIMGLQHGAERLSLEAGADPTTARFIGNLTGTAAAIVGVESVSERIRDAAVGEPLTPETKASMKALGLRLSKDITPEAMQAAYLKRAEDLGMRWTMQGDEVRITGPQNDPDAMSALSSLNAAYRYLADHPPNGSGLVGKWKAKLFEGLESIFGSGEERPASTAPTPEPSNVPRLEAVNPLPDIEARPGEAPQPPPTGVPFVMTRAMADGLRARGFTDDAIGRMSPQEAHDILAQPTPEAPGASAPRPPLESGGTPSGTPEAPRAPVPPVEPAPLVAGPVAPPEAPTTVPPAAMGQHPSEIPSDVVPTPGQAFSATGEVPPPSKAHALETAEFWLNEAEASLRRIQDGTATGHDQRVIHQAPIVAQRLMNFAELGDAERWRREQAPVSKLAQESLEHGLTGQLYHETYAKKEAAHYKPFLERMRRELGELKGESQPTAQTPPGALNRPTQEGSRYEGDNLKALIDTSVEEQKGRFTELQRLEQKLSKITKDKPKAKVKEEIQGLRNVYEDTYGEMADAGVTEDELKTIRAQVEGANLQPPTSKVEAPATGEKPKFTQGQWAPPAAKPETPVGGQAPQSDEVRRLRAELDNPALTPAREAEIRAQLKAAEAPQSGRAALIERIVAAARKPEPDIVPVKQTLYDDGKWYGHGGPYDTRIQPVQPYQHRIDHYATRSETGTIVGPSGATEAEVLEKFRRGQASRDADFRSHLQQMSEPDLQKQAKSWLKETPEVAAPPIPEPVAPTAPPVAEKTAAAPSPRLTDEQREAAQKKLKSLQKKYGVISTLHEQSIRHADTQAELDQAFATIMADLEKGKAERQAREAKTAAAKAERLRTTIEKAKQLQEAGKLVWRSRNDGSGGTEWEAVEGAPAVLKNAPKGFDFSVFRDPMVTTGDKKWAVIENQSGMAAAYGATRTKALASAEDVLEKFGDKVGEAVARYEKKQQPKLDLTAPTPKAPAAVAPVSHAFTADTLAQTFDIPKDQAEAAVAIAEAMGLDKSKIRIETGGTPAEDALYQADLLVTETPEFKKWFGDSKVVDDEGHPLVVYHGTADDFEAFDLDHPNRKDSGWLGTGVYVTTDPNLAAAYSRLKGGAGNAQVLPLFARVTNPYIATLADKNSFMLVSNGPGGKPAARRLADKWTAQLQAEGHDGVILEYQARDVGEKIAGTREIVVFDPAGVKSATGNIGTFDLNNRNLLYQEAARPSGTLESVVEGRNEPHSVRELANNVFGRKVTAMMPLQTVDRGVLAALHHDQVRRAVIAALPVNVVNNLVAAKTSAEELLRDPNVVVPRLSINHRHAVARGFVRAMARVGTELRTELSRGRFAGIDVELLPTLRASALEPNVIAGLLAPEFGDHKGTPARSVEDGAAAPGAEVPRPTSVLPDAETALATAGERGRDRARTATELSRSPERLDAEGRLTSLADYLDWHRRIVNRPEAVLRQGEKASVEFVEGGQAIIRALENPDVSSAIHEIAHVGRRQLLDRNLRADERAGVSDEDIKSAEDWAGAADGKWTREAEEKFASGFEKYLLDGEAPSPKLQSLFEKFKQWLSDIYRRLSDVVRKIKISPEMRKVYDRLVTRAERLAAEGAEEAPVQREYSSTQINLPEGLAERVRDVADLIPEADLAAQGRETEPHVTLQYGLHDEAPDAVREALAGHGPVDLTLGRFDHFPDTGHGDVVYLGLETADRAKLMPLRGAIAQSGEVSDTFPDYRPHISLAYVKPGTGEEIARYLNEHHSLAGQTFTGEAVEFSSATGEKTTIPLAEREVTPAGAPTETTPRTLHLEIYDALKARILAKGLGAALPKAPQVLRHEMAKMLGVPESALKDDIDALNDAVEAVLADRLADEIAGDYKFDLAPTTARQMTQAIQTEAFLPRAHRTLEKTALQQFSTPLPIAVVAARALDLQPGDRVLEPTAGTGNLLAPLKPQAEKIGATIQAAELAPRRADLLREQGYAVHQGDYLRSTPPDLTQPTAIITNPPWGKYSKGKYGAGVAMGFGPSDVAERFVGKNMRDLAEGGRLVAVMPTTMLDSSSFKNWLRSNYAVRAIIKAPPDAYRTRATNVDSVLLVVDKIEPVDTKELARPLPKVIVTKDWEEYRGAVEGLPARGAIQPAAPLTRPAVPGAGAGPGRPLAGRQPTGGRPEPAQPGRNAPVGAERPADVVAAEREPEPAVREPAGPAPARLPRASADARRAAERSESFAPYPRRTTLRGAEHPKLVVEAKQLAGVDYPPLTYQPHSDLLNAVKLGRVSVEQAEQAIAAVQANVVNHHGYLAADAVGVGKSREIALTILEAMQDAKAKNHDLRLIVTTKSRDNIADLIDKEIYYVATGRTRDGIDLANPDREKEIPPELPFTIEIVTDRPNAKKNPDEAAYEPLPVHKHGIYVIDSFNLAPYGQSLANVGAHGIIGDEAHKFKNVEGAAVGGTWQRLHATILRDTPRDQQFFAYFTATPAQSVEDYAYLYGLRMWPVDGFASWLEMVTGGATEEDAKKLAEATERGAIDMPGVAGGDGKDVVGGDGEDVGGSKKSQWGRPMGGDVFTARLTPSEAEQIPREWKMLGRFSARDLWREGTEFQIHEAKLKPQDEKKYNQFVELAQDIIATAAKYGMYDKSGKASRFGVTGQLQFAAKRVQLQPALEEAIRIAQEEVAKGNQVVLSLINVSEMNGEAGNIAAAIAKINTREIDEDPNDPDGGLVDLGEIPEAIADQARLLDRARDLGTFDDPLDMVDKAVGKENVAFITGGTGSTRQQAIAEFQAGKRDYAVLSQAGSTGISLDHRIFTDKAPGRGRRVFIDVQYEWSATEALQRYGRVDRASSISPPKIIALTFGNASEKKFLATIANRMASLGALSKGGAESTGGASALEEFEITGDDALQAARDAYAVMPEEVKRHFALVKSAFRDPNRETKPDREGYDPFLPKHTATNVTMRDFQLPLLFMPIVDSNKFWTEFIERRDKLREESGAAKASRTSRLKGEILDKKVLKPNLTLYSVKNEDGQKFGILSGLVTQEIPKLRTVLAAGEWNPDTGQYESNLTRRYVTFAAPNDVATGLQIKWTKLPRVAELYGAEMAGEKLDTADKVKAYLKAGERLALKETNPDSGKPWGLRWRPTDERILVENARMADRTLLLHNGAGYAPVGNYWYVVDLPKFLERFPLADASVKKSASSAGGGTTLQATIVPGAKEFVEQDVIPTVRNAAIDVNRVRVDIKGLFAPAAASTEARDFSHIVRARLAERDQRSERARRVLKKMKVAFDYQLRGKTPEQKADFLLSIVDPIETGHLEGLPPDVRRAADLFRELLDGRRRDVQRLGRLQDYIRNYFPHEWAKPNAAKTALLRLFGKRPLQGPKSFLKQRTIPTTRAGIEAGLMPVSYNPVDLVLLKLYEMDKFIAATKILKDGQRQGLSVFVPAGADPPPGFVRFNHSFATVYGRPFVQVKEAYDPKVMEGLYQLASDLGVKHDRLPRIGGRRWGYAEGAAHVVTKFAGPEGVLMHELGHILDERYGLRHRMVRDPAFREELRRLADLRDEGEIEERTESRKRYVRKGEEKIANLVHAYLYAPDRLRAVAPNSYNALEALINAHRELRPLRDTQRGRSLKLGVASTEIPVGGAVVKGYYYGPPEVVRLIDNHLSAGLRGSALFNLYRRAGNFLNQVQLGLSMFHFTMTGLESVISKQSIALEHLMRGEVGQALRKQLEVPIAPLVDLYRGHQALKEFYAQDANADAIDSIVSTVVQGGGAFSWSLFEHEGAPAKFMEALRTGNYLGAGLRAIPALVELQAKPIMEGWVPRLKMAAFLDMMRMEMPTLGPDPDLQEVRRIAADAWDAVDDRFGQLRYDNIFWHNALKDLGMATVRALGWNVGSIRHAFGAPLAQLRQIGLIPGAGAGGGGWGKRPIRMFNVGFDEDGNPQYEPVKEPWFHRKLSWLISTVFVYGLAGAIYLYLHTGRRPKDLKDYFFPNGVSIPGYPKDWYAFFHALPGSAVETAKHKANPLLSLLTDLITNEDYFGNAIRNPDDPLMDKVKDMLRYLVAQYRPISVQGFQQRRQEEAMTGKAQGVNAIESFFGINRAPGSVTRTPAEELVRQFNPPQPRTQQQARQAELRRTIRQGMAAGTAEGRAAARTAAETGELSKRRIANAIRASRTSALEAGVKSLTLPQALQVYEAASPDERATIYRVVDAKAGRLGDAPRQQQQWLRARIQKVLTLPRTTIH